MWIFSTFAVVTMIVGATIIHPLAGLSMLAALVSGSVFACIMSLKHDFATKIKHEFLFMTQKKVREQGARSEQVVDVEMLFSP